MRWLRWKPVVLALVLVLVALASGGCGGDDRLPPPASPENSKTVKWMVDVCDELTAWLRDLQDGGGPLAARVEGAETAAEAQALLARFLEDTARATDELNDRVERLGDPPIAGGARAAARLRRNLAAVHAHFAGSAQEAQGLPVGDPAAFAAGRAQLLGAVHAGAKLLRVAYADLEEGEPHRLGKLGSQEPQCNAIYSDGPDGPIPAPGFTV